MIRLAGAFIALFCGSALAAGPEDIDFAAAASLPREVWEALGGQPGLAVETRINPFYLQADFDGDGWRDTAVLVRDKVSGKHGVAIVLKAGRVRPVCAGRDIGDGTDNLDWMDAWHVQRRGTLEQGATGKAPPKLKADGLMVIKTESGSAVIYWDGRRFRYYQQGD